MYMHVLPVAAIVFLLYIASSWAVDFGNFDSRWYSGNIASYNLENILQIYIAVLF